MAVKKAYSSLDFLGVNRILNLPNPTNDSDPATKAYVDQAIQNAISQSNLSRVSFTIGDGTNTTFTLNHNLGTRNVVVQAYHATSYEDVGVSVKRISANAVEISFPFPPAQNSIVVVIIG